MSPHPFFSHNFATHAHTHARTHTHTDTYSYMYVCTLMHTYDGAEYGDRDIGLDTGCDRGLSAGDGLA